MGEELLTQPYLLQSTEKWNPSQHLTVESDNTLTDSFTLGGIDIQNKRNGYFFPKLY
jgi:hypothetical protein